MLTVEQVIRILNNSREECMNAANTLQCPVRNPSFEVIKDH